MSHSAAAGQPVWKKMVFSEIILNKSPAHRIAYIGIMTALCILANTFEIKFADVQYSVTIFTSMLAGILIGPLSGAAAAFLGDFIGYAINSMAYPYYWWVALSVALMAVIAGLFMRLPFSFRGSIYVKLALACIASFFLCSVLINSLGGYYIGLKIYFAKDLLDYFETQWGGQNTFGIYLLYRFFFKGQIFNSIANFVLLFLTVPTLRAIRPLKLDIR